MSAIDYLLNARKSLDALARLLNEAAARNAPTDEILEQAMLHLREARQIIDSMMDDEGTE